MTSTTATPPVARRKQNKPKAKSKLGWNLIGLVVFATVGFPVYWMLNTAFKPAKDAIDPNPTSSRAPSPWPTSGVRWRSRTSGAPSAEA